MRWLGVILLFSSFNLAFANGNTSKVTHQKITDAVQSLQSSNWILDDLESANEIFCSSKDAQDLFDLAHANLKSAADILKNQIVKNDLNEEALLGVRKMVNDSYSTFKSLIFFGKIVIKKSSTDVKFEQSRYRQMKAIISVDEYIENGDEDIYNPINQRNSALAFFMQKIESSWNTDILATLPSYISQTDLKLINKLIESTNYGSISRYLKAYFKNHQNGPVQDNLKGEVAVMIVKHAGGWSLDALEVLPEVITRAMYNSMSTIVTTSDAQDIAGKLKDYISKL